MPGIQIWYWADKSTPSMPIYSNSKDQALKTVEFWTKKVAKFYYLTELTNQNTENGSANTPRRSRWGHHGRKVFLIVLIATDHLSDRVDRFRQHVGRHSACHQYITQLCQQSCTITTPSTSYLLLPNMLFHLYFQVFFYCFTYTDYIAAMSALC